MESSSHDLPLPPFLWQPPPAPFQPRFHHAKGLLIMVFVTLFLFLVALLSVLIQRYRRRDPFGWRARSPPPTLQTHVRDVKHGLDAAVIDSFPTFLYSDVKQTSPTPRGAVAAECAVCLSEFNDEEKLRLLPRCSHVFHVACIDMWLDSHSTCPVCRAQLDGEPQPAADAAPAEADGEAWTEEERERFTLRIDPEEVRRRSRSLGRGEGSSATMGSGRAATWVGKALSERWAMLARGRPAELSKRSCGEGTSSGGGAANLV